MYYVDDLLISHESLIIVTDRIKMLDEIYGSKDPLSITREKVHEYLGMMIDFRQIPGSCIITQYDFIKKLYTKLPEGLRGAYRGIPTAEYLFKIDSNAKKLSKQDKEHYHEVTAKCL